MYAQVGSRLAEAPFEANRGLQARLEKVFGEVNEATPSMRRYLKDEMCFGQYRTLAYSAWLLATVRDQLHKASVTRDWNEVEKALLTSNLGMVAYDQVCLQGGQDWSTGWLMTHLPEPPFSHIARTPPRDQLRPLSPLADPVWSAAALAYLRDAEVVADRHEQRMKRKPGKKGDGKGASPSAGEGL